MAEDGEVKPGFTNEPHPDVFNVNAMLPQKEEKKTGQLPDSLIKKFFEQGFVIILNFFKPEELEPAKEDIGKLVDDVEERLFKSGKIKRRYNECDSFSEKLVLLEKEWPGATYLMLKQQIVPKGIQDVWANERLLNLIEQIIGPDISGHPVWQIRCKIPRDEVTVVPWHQDSGYFDNDSYKFIMPTAWIPLVNATEENGCMQYIAGGHQQGLVVKHKACWKDTMHLFIEEEELKTRLDVDLDKDVKTCPVPYGGLILFNNMIPHRSIPNVSKSDIRWSLDLRFMKSSNPVGFFGIKDGLQLRSSKDPNFKVSFDKFNSKDRNEEYRNKLDSKKEDDLDILFPGPWMKKWEIVHPNEHTRALFAKNVQ